MRTYSMMHSHDAAPIRCLVAKVGLDGHDRGAHVIARRFSDAGFEVVYTGLHRSPDEIVQAAVQEDIDVLGISILSGAHNTLIPKITNQLEQYDALHDTLVVVGGIIPDKDEETLREAGVDEIFGPGTEMDAIVEYVKDNTPKQEHTHTEPPETHQRRCDKCGRFISKKDGKDVCDNH